MMYPTRRDALRALAGSFAAALAAGPSACAPRAEDGRVTASLWFAYGGKNREVLLSLIEQFHASQDRFRIHATYQGDYFEALAKLRTAIAARAAPTLTHVIGEVLPYLAEAGVLEPLDSFGDTRGFDLVPELAQARGFTEGERKPLYGLPFNRSTPIAYYNKKIFKDLGLSPPETWDELRAVAARATEHRNGGTRWGFECPIDWWFWLALLGQAGGSVIEADGTPSLGGEAGVRALSLWQTLVHEDRTMRPPPGRDYNAWQVANTDFLSGSTAMIWTSTAFLRYLEESAKFEVGAAPLPRDVRRSVPTGGTLFVMPKGPPRAEQEAAFAFLHWMMQPAQANAWATRTGYIPVSQAGIRELEASGYYRLHVNDRVALDQLAFAAPWPWARDLFRIERENRATAPGRVRPRAPPRARRARRGPRRREGPVKPRRPLDPYLMLAPTALILGFFFLYPLVLAAKQSLYSWDLLTPPTYVGAKNYSALVSSGELLGTVGRTLGYSVVVVVLSVTLGLALAVALNRPGRVYAFVRGAVFSAYVVSWVAVALLWMWILDADRGLLTSILRALHLPTLNWLGDPNVALYTLALVSVWKITGYAMVIFLAGLQDIPPSLHEAAALDGAGPWNRFFHVTWPLLRPSAAFVATTSLILSFQAFDVVRVMTQGGPVKATTIFVYAIYEHVFVNLKVGRASALIVVFFVLLLGLTSLQLWVFRRGAGRTRGAA
ncbi:MAG: extracellular solute-binding protein [Minicystis sp.]